MENTFRLDEIIDVERQIDHIIKDYDDGFSKRYTEYHYTKEKLNKKICSEENDINILNGLISKAEANIKINKLHISDCDMKIKEAKREIAELQKRKQYFLPPEVYTTDENGVRRLDQDKTQENKSMFNRINEEIQELNSSIDKLLKEKDKREKYNLELDGMIDAMTGAIQRKNNLINLLNEDLDMLYDEFTKFQYDHNKDISKLKDILWNTKKAEKQINSYGWNMRKIAYSGSLSVFFCDVQTVKVTSKDLMAEVTNLLIYIKLEKQLIETLSKKTEVYLNNMNSKDPVTVTAAKINTESLQNIKKIVEYYEKYCEWLKAAANELAIYERISV